MVLSQFAGTWKGDNPRPADTCLLGQQWGVSSEEQAVLIRQANEESKKRKVPWMQPSAGSNAHFFVSGLSGSAEPTDGRHCMADLLRRLDENQASVKRASGKPNPSHILMVKSIRESHRLRNSNHIALQSRTEDSLEVRNLRDYQVWEWTFEASRKGPTPPFTKANQCAITT